MLWRITAVSAVVVALAGWACAAYQLVTSRWVDATALLVAAAAGASVGAVLVVAAGTRPRLGAVVAGLLLVAVAASIFAYPLSALTLLLLIVHIGRAIARRPRSVQKAAGQ